jgi:dephospho-CoA kinase
MKPLIAIVGMSGAGKSEAGLFFKEKGYAVLRFGTVIVEEIEKEGLILNPENERLYREKIRSELGMGAVAIKMLPRIKETFAITDKIVLDGLYSWEEYKLLKKEYTNLVLLCIYAKPEIRYERLVTRKDRNFTFEEARQRDEHEIEVINKGGPIAMADYVIVNETSQEHLEDELARFLKELIK